MADIKLTKGIYLFQTFSKYRELKLKYQPIMQKVLIQNGTKFLEEKEKELFFEGMGEIVKYIKNSFLYTVRNDYPSKSNVEKIISAIFFRYSRYAGGFDHAYKEIEDVLERLAEQSFFFALGLERYKNRNFKWRPETIGQGNFIKYCTKHVFNELVLNFMREKEQEIENSTITVNEEEKIDSLLSLLEKKKSSIPERTYIDIYKYLTGEKEEYTKDSLPYMKRLYEENKE